MNQWLGDNRYRRYPFQQDTAIPFLDTVVVDAQIVLSTKFDVTDVQLVSVTAATGTLTMVFSIISSGMPGYTLETVVSTAAADEIRVLLALKLSGVAHPELGYGYLMIGKPSDLVDTASAAGLSAKLDRSVIRYSVSHDALRVRVANKLRAGASTIVYTPGTPDPFGVVDRTATIVTDCNERAATPTPQQRHMSTTVRGNTTTLVSVPATGGTHTVLSAGSTRTITTRPAVGVATVPTLPSDRDADVDTGVVASTVVVSQGYNVKLTGDIVAKSLQFNYRLGGGLGMDCSGILGYSSALRSRECVKSLNGVYPAEQDLQLIADPGVAVLPDQNGHRIVLVINPLNLKRVAP